MSGKSKRILCEALNVNKNDISNIGDIVSLKKKKVTEYENVSL